MERILFYQNERLNEPSCIFVDGRSVDSAEAAEQLQLLFRFVERLGSKQEPWETKLDKYYVVKGFLDHNDEIGRRMTFVYVLPATTYSEQDLLHNLRQDLSLGGMSLGEETLQAISSYESSKQRQHTAVIVATVVALLLVIYQLLK